MSMEELIFQFLLRKRYRGASETLQHVYYRTEPRH